MEKAAVRMLRWSVVLGLLVALPALALRGKSGEIAELWFDDTLNPAPMSVEPVSEDWMFPVADPPAGSIASQTLKPLDRPDQLPPEDRSHSRPSQNTFGHPPPDAGVRTLRASVYRPLGGGEDQAIRRIRVENEVEMWQNSPVR